jgi:hypothetical protein
VGLRRFGGVNRKDEKLEKLKKMGFMAFGACLPENPSYDLSKFRESLRYSAGFKQAG